mgnify:CR=1 FL=1
MYCNISIMCFLKLNYAPVTTREWYLCWCCGWWMVSTIQTSMYIMYHNIRCYVFSQSKVCSSSYKKWRRLCLPRLIDSNKQLQKQLLPLSQNVRRFLTQKRLTFWDRGSIILLTQPDSEIVVYINCWQTANQYAVHHIFLLHSPVL